MLLFYRILKDAVKHVPTNKLSQWGSYIRSEYFNDKPVTAQQIRQKCRNLKIDPRSKNGSSSSSRQRKRKREKVPESEEESGTENTDDLEWKRLQAEEEAHYASLDVLPAPFEVEDRQGLGKWVLFHRWPHCTYELSWNKEKNVVKIKIVLSPPDSEKDFQVFVEFDENDTASKFRKRFKAATENLTVREFDWSFSLPPRTVFQDNVFAKNKKWCAVFFWYESCSHGEKTKILASDSDSDDEKQ